MRLPVAVRNPDRSPAAGADVVLFHRPDDGKGRRLVATTVTSDDGTCTFLVRPGRFEARARRPGLVGWTAPQDIVLPDAQGGAAAGMAVALVAEQRIRGRVELRETGAPVEGAVVTMSEAGPDVRDVTGADGRFEITGLLAGRSGQLQVASRGHLMTGSDGVRRSDDEIEWTVVMRPAAVVRGVLRRPDGASGPFGRTSISVPPSAADMGCAMSLDVADDGSFETTTSICGPDGLPFIRSAGCAPTRIPATFTSPGVHDLGVIHLRPAAILRGTVVDARGRPLSDVIVRALSAYAGALAEQTATAADGTFSFDAIGSEEHTVWAIDAGPHPRQGDPRPAVKREGVVAGTPLVIEVPEGNAVRFLLVDAGTAAPVAPDSTHIRLREAGTGEWTVYGGSGYRASDVRKRVPAAGRWDAQIDASGYETVVLPGVEFPENDCADVGVKLTRRTD
ncbi:MAG: hypothetical protein HMLKMBBP_03888 [Planctomycetes bacterium]|nr:hypothetical protein [Planctomycetota bacterium]